MEYNNTVYLIGENVENIKKCLGLFKDTKTKIENYWKIYSDEINDMNIAEVFEDLIQKISDMIDDYTKTYSFTIIYSLGKFKEEKKNILNLIERIVDITSLPYYQPFLILLAQNKEDKTQLDQMFKNDVENIDYDKRNISIFISPLNNNYNEDLIKEIRVKIFKIFAYYYEIDDETESREIIINKQKYILPYKLYIEPEEDFIEINFLILGKTQVGKSTFINTILKQKKSKEGGIGSNMTKKQLSYHVDGIPLILNDIEGFIGEETIKKVTDNIEFMQKKLGNKELNLVIYIIDYNGPTYFNENEYLIFKQLSSKLEETQFLFVCLKSDKKENYTQKVKQIQGSFYQMIKNGLTQNSEKDNIMNVLNYLYLCSVLLYEKIDNFDISEGDNEDRNKKMIEKIIELNKTLFFVNIIKDNNHKEIFGMNKVINKIRQILRYTKEKNMKCLYNIINENEENINDIDTKYQQLKVDSEEKKELKDFIEFDNDINSIRRDNYDKNENSLKEIQSINLKQRKNDFNELIKCIKEEKCLNIAKKYAEELKNQLLESLKKDLRKHKIGAAISGIIPLGDILIQHFIKKDAKEKVSQKFKDDLLDFEKKNKNEKNIKNKEQESIEGIKDKIDDKKSDIMKTIGRITTIGINIGLKTVSVAVGFVGCIIGVVTGGLVISYDINAYLEFYGNRFVNKCLLNFSFNLVDKYFEENFENNEENDSFKNENKYIEKTICINNNNINIKSTLEKFITIYIIKNEELKYLPQIEIKFNKINNINKEFISEFKEEIKNIINNDNFSIIEIKKGSLTVILALQFLILIELGKYNNKEQNKFNIEQFSENFTIKIRKEVQKLCEILIKNVFISLGAVKPTYANPNIIDISDKNNQ